MNIRTLLIVIALVLAILALIPATFAGFNVLALSVIILAIALLLGSTRTNNTLG